MPFSFQQVREIDKVYRQSINWIDLLPWRWERTWTYQPLKRTLKFFVYTHIQTYTHTYTYIYCVYRLNTKAESLNLASPGARFSVFISSHPPAHRTRSSIYRIYRSVQISTVVFLNFVSWTVDGKPYHGVKGGEWTWDCFLSATDYRAVLAVV